MKKTITAILLIIVIIVIIITMQIRNIAQNKQEALSFNSEYEKYKDKDLYGIDIVTVINKAIDNNTKYNIVKDEKGRYIEDEENSIKVELNLIASVDEKTGEKNIVTHPMERLMEVGLDGFITNFNLTTFKVNKIEYHKKTGRVSKIVFEQIEE